MPISKKINPYKISKSTGPKPSTKKELQEAQKEVNIAIQLLQQFADSSPSTEITTYIKKVSTVVEEKINADVAAQIAVSLQSARTQLAEDATSFPIWAAITRAVDPSSGSRSIPRRFLRRETKDTEPTLTITHDDIHVEMMVRTFRGDENC